MKKIKNLVLMTAAFITSMIMACSISCFSTDVVKAENASGLLIANGNSSVTYDVDMPSYTSKSWNGAYVGAKVTLRGTGINNRIETAKYYELSDLENLLTFVPTPREEVYNDKEYLTEIKDMRVRIVEFEENSSKNMVETGRFVEYFYRANWGDDKEIRKGYIEGSAKGLNAKQQEFYGYFGGLSYGDSLDPTVVGGPRADAVGAGAVTTVPGTLLTDNPLTFGYSQSEVVRTFETPLTADDEKALREKFTVISISADRQSATLMLSKGTATPLRDAAANKGVFRIFSEYRDPLNAASGMMDKILFEGFESDSKFKVYVYAYSYKKDAVADIMFFNIAGDSLSNYIQVENKYRGEVGLTCPIAEPICYSPTNNQKLVNPSYSVKVLRPNGSELVSGVKLTSFVPDVAGTYKIVYTNEGKSRTNEVEVLQELVPMQITGVTPANVGAQYMSDYVINGSAISNAYLDGNTVIPIDVKLYKHNGSQWVDTGKSFEIGDIFNAREQGLEFGKYKFVYTATDLIGRTAVEEVEMSFTQEDRASIEFLNGTTKNLTYVLGANDIIISADNVTIFDAIYGRDFIKAKVLINDGVSDTEVIGDLSLIEYLSTRSVKCGKYTIKYIFKDDTYDSGIDTKVVKTLNILDVTAPYLHSVSDKYVYGSVFEGIDEESGLIKLKALKGETLKFVKLVAYDEAGEKYSLSDSIKLNVIVPNEGMGKDVAFDNGNFSYTFDKEGVYTFTFSVSDTMYGKANITTTLTYNIDVREKWYTASGYNGYSVSDNVTDFTIQDFIVTDFYGNKVDSTKTVVAKNDKGEVVWTANVGDVKRFDDIGTYTITTDAKVDGEVVVSLTSEVTIVDKHLPTIELTGDKTVKGVVGSKVKVPTVAFKDDNGNVIADVVVSVDGQLINVINDEFVPVQSGKYLVKYTATDINGNVNEYEYVIEIEKAKTSPLANFFNKVGVYIGGALVLVAVALIVLKKIKVIK